LCVNENNAFDEDSDRQAFHYESEAQKKLLSDECRSQEKKWRRSCTWEM